jgi:hypothetical protein
MPSPDVSLVVLRDRLLQPGARNFTMLVTLVAILCNGQLCMEKVVTSSEQSGITMSACQVDGQLGIADWLAKGPYQEWKVQGYKCVLGKYTPKRDA